MTDSERQQILKMIQDGKISAEQGLVLMQALEEEPERDGVSVEPAVVEAGSGQPASKNAVFESGHKSDPEFDRKINQFRSLWMIPLWVGVVITIAGAYWMYAALQANAWGFWFFLAWLPFLLGVALTALALSSRSSRWIYINIRQKPGETPQRIVLTFPLTLVSWVLQFARFRIPEQNFGAADQVMDAIFVSTQSDGPFLVDVDDEDGEHVQVYIG